MKSTMHVFMYSAFLCLVAFGGVLFALAKELVALRGELGAYSERLVAFGVDLVFLCQLLVDESPYSKA